MVYHISKSVYLPSLRHAPSLAPQAPRGRCDLLSLSPFKTMFPLYHHLAHAQIFFISHGLYVWLFVVKGLLTFQGHL